MDPDAYAKHNRPERGARPGVYTHPNIPGEKLEAANFAAADAFVRQGWVYKGPRVNRQTRLGETRLAEAEAAADEAAKQTVKAAKAREEAARAAAQAGYQGRMTTDEQIEVNKVLEADAHKVADEVVKAGNETAQKLDDEGNAPLATGSVIDAQEGVKPFNKLTKPELVALAVAESVEIAPDATNDQIRKAITEARKQKGSE